MGDFLAFRKMLTPILIQVVFWVGVLACVIVGLTRIGSQPLIGFLILVVGPLAVRIYCELLMVIFTINDSLVEIRKNSRPSGATS